MRSNCRTDGALVRRLPLGVEVACKFSAFLEQFIPILNGAMLGCILDEAFPNPRPIVFCRSSALRLLQPI